MLNNFRFLTSGESHGKCLTGIIDGVPAGFCISLDFINEELKSRQSGYGRGDRMNIEADEIEIKAGVRFGKTTGAPICLEIRNKDYENWQKIMCITEQSKEAFDSEKVITKPRPGHADFAGAVKYNLKDLRDVLERSSARKTAIDVAIGAVAQQILKEFDITGYSNVISIGGEVEDAKMKEKIDFAKENGDTLGGKFEIIFKNLPIGLGSHVQWDRKLDGLISQAVMSIPAIKSVEIGLGRESADVLGSEMHDEIFVENGKYFRKTNNAGGLEGGMTNGESLVVKAAMKPIPTIKKHLHTIDFSNSDNSEYIYPNYERSDICAVHACSIIAKAMIACVLADAFLDKHGKDNLEQIKKNYSTGI